MHHTYTLSCRGFIPPSVSRSSDKYQAEVTDPRTLIVAFGEHQDKMTLVLLDEEPDLPVGSTVCVWLSRWFHCETQEYIEHKRNESEKKAAERAAHEEQVKQLAEETYLNATHALLCNSPDKKAIKTRLDSLYSERDRQYRIYRAYWRSPFPELKQQSDDAYTIVSVLNSSVDSISEYAFRTLEEQGIKACVAYAYSPREGGSNGSFSPGRDHFQLLTPLNKGRLKREERDALCKPIRNFWGLESFGSHRPVSCQACLTKMINLINN